MIAEERVILVDSDGREVGTTDQLDADRASPR